jgi:hypothetical protein
VAGALPLWRDRRVIVGGGLTLILIVGLAVSLVVLQGDPPRPVWREEPAGQRRVRLSDRPDASWLSYWESNKLMLGDPQWEVAAYRLRGDLKQRDACVGFTQYIICRTTVPQGTGAIWLFEPLPLGAEALARLRLMPEPGAAADPIVQQYLTALAQDAALQGDISLRGVDDIRQYWLGRTLSKPICLTGADGRGGECMQVFERQVLRWPLGATDSHTIRLSPLGLEAPRP